ncbi:MAG: TetR/AcrR family transcriptional regulator [Actinomycetota bacterium]|nr:TetR/AcrR family transcriptional regulator [Actinomycetota bacterium]
MATVAPPAPRIETASRILSAAFDCISDVGLGRTTVEDVARNAGIARQTVYRYFPSKDHLITALVLQEQEKFLDGIRAAFDASSNLETSLEEGLLFCLRFAREHPLLDRLLRTDPETLLPYLTVRAAPAMRRAREVLKQLITKKAWVRANVIDSAVDSAVRVAVSYALTPPDQPPEVVAHGLARILTMALTGKEVRQA